MRKAGQTLAIAVIFAANLSAQDAFSPARYRSGILPPVPSMALGGGQVFLELSVSADGRVTAITPLRTTPPFTDAMIAAVRTWQFIPAEATPVGAAASTPRQRVPSRVLVAGVFRRPTLIGPSLGEVPRDVASESDETPFPVTAIEPLYPPLARDPGLSLVEVEIGLSGDVVNTAVIGAAPPFDEEARAAAQLWSFRPSRVRGRSVATRAYVVFGFATPIAMAPSTGGAAPPPRGPMPPRPPSGGPNQRPVRSQAPPTTGIAAPTLQGTPRPPARQ